LSEDSPPWNSFENENTNISVHLKDFRPELYQDKYEFEFAHQAMELYEQFLPELITEKLEHFLNFS
jgi:heptosyltransferase-2